MTFDKKVREAAERYAHNNGAKDIRLEGYTHRLHLSDSFQAGATYAQNELEGKINDCFDHLNTKDLEYNKMKSQLELMTKSKEHWRMLEMNASGKVMELTEQLAEKDAEITAYKKIHLRQGGIIAKYQEENTRLAGLVEEVRKALIFYQKVESPHLFQNKINISNDWIECQVTYKGPSRAGEALTKLDSKGTNE